MGVLKPIEKANQDEKLESETLDKKAKIEKLQNKWHLTIDEFSIV